MDKKILFIGIFIFLLVGQINFVLSEETGDLLDIGTLLEIKGEIEGTGIAYEKIGEDSYRLTIDGENSLVNINGINFENIASSSPLGVIEIDYSGNIRKVSFFVNDNGGTYTINDVRFKAPPNSIVKYDEETGFELNNAKVDYIKGYEETGKISSTAFYKEIPFYGENINFFDKVVVDGSGSIIDGGFLIKDGTAKYEGMNIANLGTERNFMIITDPGVEAPIDISWIREDASKIEVQSSKNSRININILEDNKIFDVGEHGKFDMTVSFGDKITMEKVRGLFSEINHETNGGTFSVRNNGLSLVLHKISEVDVNTNSVKMEDILSGKYRSVPCLIKSNSEGVPEEISIDSRGTVTGTIYKLVNAEFKEKIVYQMSTYANILNNNLEHEDLLEIVNTLQENNLEEPFYLSSVAYLAQEATKKGWSNDQTRDLVLTTVDSSKDFSDIILEKITLGMSNIGDKISQEDFIEFTLNRLEDPKKVPYFLYSYDILEGALDSGKDLDLVEDFLDRAIKTTDAGFDMYDKKDFLKDGIGEYDGTNFAEINQGIDLSLKYGLSNAIPLNFDLDYSDINNKKDLSIEYANALDKYFKKGDVDPSVAQLGSYFINKIHDYETKLDGSDDLRKSVIKNLDPESIYYMIASSTGNDDLYTSSFFLMYDELPKENLVEVIKRADPDGKWIERFMVKAGAKGVLKELYVQEPDYYEEIIKKSLSNQEELYENTVMMSELIREIYKSPEDFNSEEEDWEKFFINKYEQADTLREKVTYSYLLKINDNPSEKNKDFIGGLPKIIGDKVPINILEYMAETGEFNRNFYFRDDEVWFDVSQDDFIENYDMEGIFNNEKKARLTQNIEGIDLNFDFTLNPLSEEIFEDIESGKVQAVDFRTHSYNLVEMMENIASNQEIMAHVGSCGSFEDMPYIEQHLKSASTSCVRGTGQGYINNEVAYKVSVEIIKKFQELMARGGIEEVRRVGIYYADLDIIKELESKGIIFPYKMTANKYIKEYS